MPSTTAPSTPSACARRTVSTKDSATRALAVGDPLAEHQGGGRVGGEVVAGCGSPGESSSSWASASDCSRAGRSRVTGARSSSTPRSATARSVPRRQVEVQRGGAVVEVDQGRLVDGCGVVADQRRTDVPGAGARRTALGAEVVEVGRLPDRRHVDPVERGPRQHRPDVGVGRVVAQAPGLAQHRGGRRLPGCGAVGVVLAHQPERALLGLQLLGLVQSTVEVAHESQDRASVTSVALRRPMG